MNDVQFPILNFHEAPQYTISNPILQDFSQSPGNTDLKTNTGNIQHISNHKTHPQAQKLQLQIPDLSED